MKMFLVSLVSNNLSNFGIRHFKLFTNCHVSWDTLYQTEKLAVAAVYVPPRFRKKEVS